MKVWLLVLFAVLICVADINAQKPSVSDDHNSWIAGVIKETSKIKPGMTRANLLTVFEEEGGLSTGIRRTYAFRDCPYIKVDVEFEPVGRPPRDPEGRVSLIESNRDIIKKISKPYLAWAISD